MTKPNPTHEQAIRAALAAQIESELAIRRAFDGALLASKARRPAPSTTAPTAKPKPKPRPARDDSDLERMKRLARGAGWRPPRPEAPEPGVLAGWHRIGGA